MITNLLKAKANPTIWEKFKKLWMYYILQSLIPAVVLCILVCILGADRMVLISAIGATAFVLFAMPTTVSAKTKHVIGGHLVALVVGALFCLISLPYFLEYSLALATAIFFMVALDVEHPPAVGTALAVVINESSLRMSFIAVMISVVVLTQCRYYLRHHLKDLL